MERNAFIARLFERAREVDPDAVVEVCFGGGDSFEVEFQKGEMVEYSVSDTAGLGVRVLTKGKLGYASTQILDEDAVEMLVVGAMENAALVESEDEQFIYPGAESYPEIDPYSPALEGISAAEKIALAKKLEQLTLDQDPRIAQASASIFQITSNSGMRNSLGLDLTSRGNLIGGFVEAVARDGDEVNTGGKAFSALSLDEIDLTAAAKIAADEALSGLGGEAVPSGRYRALLRNDVARTLLSTFAGIFSAEAAQRGLSRLNGREGEKIAAECVSIIDDPHREGSAASCAYDGEGVPTRRKAVVERGVLKTLLHNLKTANKQGVETTANARRAGFAGPVGIGSTNFYIEPSEDDFDAMLARVKDGLLITDLQGMHAGANPVTGDFSLAAKGFRVRDGKIAEPVAQITVAGNFYDLLKEIEAVGADLEFGIPFDSCKGSPSLLLPALSVAGE